jgi:hypothetical protein
VDAQIWPISPARYMIRSQYGFRNPRRSRFLKPTMKTRKLPTQISHDPAVEKKKESCRSLFQKDRFVVVPQVRRRPRSSAIDSAGLLPSEPSPVLLRWCWEDRIQGNPLFLCSNFFRLFSLPLGIHRSTKLFGVVM